MDKNLNFDKWVFPNKLRILICDANDFFKNVDASSKICSCKRKEAIRLVFWCPME